jgi:endonuclease/exonuclease/phosphatase (EEP) superfamily protein YafD
VSILGDAPRLVVMTANIGNGLADPGQVAEEILKAGADLVGLQEVSGEQGDALVRALSSELPHLKLQERGIPGKAIFSRHPLIETGPIEIVRGRPDLMARVDMPGGPIRLVVAHPEPPRFGLGSGARNMLSGQQIRHLAESIRHAGEPGLLMGDLNRVSWQRAARALSEMGLIDAWLAGGSGPGFTLPARWAHGAYRGHPLGEVRLPPFARVDYVWHTPHFMTEDAWLGAAAGSDHLPVVARLIRRGQP